MACAFDTLAAMLSYGFIENQEFGKILINPLAIDYAKAEKDYQEALKEGGGKVHTIPYQEQLPDDFADPYNMEETVSDWLSNFHPTDRPFGKKETEEYVKDVTDNKRAADSFIERWVATDTWIEKLMEKGALTQVKEKVSVFDFMAAQAVDRAFNIANQKVEAWLHSDISDPMSIARNIGGDYTLSNQEMWDVDNITNWKLYLASGIGEAFYRMRSTGTTKALVAEEVSTRNRQRSIYDHIERAYHGYRRNIGGVAGIRLLMSDNMVGSITESQMDAAEMVLPSFVRMKMSGMTDRNEDVNKVFAIRPPEVERTYTPIVISRGKADISHLLGSTAEEAAAASQQIHHLSLLSTTDAEIVENRARNRPFIKWTFPRLFKNRNPHRSDRNGSEYKNEERRRRWMFWLGKFSNGEVSMSDGYVIDSGMELKLRDGRVTLDMGRTRLGENIVYKGGPDKTDTVGLQTPKATLNDLGDYAGKQIAPHSEAKPTVDASGKSVAMSTASLPDEGSASSPADLPENKFDTSAQEDPGPPVSDQDRDRIANERKARADKAKAGRKKK
jgi:hypothetical protein